MKDVKATGVPALGTVTMELVAVKVCVPVVILDETETVTTVMTAGYFSSIVPRNQDEERC